MEVLRGTVVEVNQIQPVELLLSSHASTRDLQRRDLGLISSHTHDTPDKRDIDTGIEDPRRNKDLRLLRSHQVYILSPELYRVLTMQEGNTDAQATKDTLENTTVRYLGHQEHRHPTMVSCSKRRDCSEVVSILITNDALLLCRSVTESALNIGYVQQEDFDVSEQPELPEFSGSCMV